MAADPSKLPAPQIRPRHVAVIMDGNGRWARRQGLRRHAGHRAGVKAARNIVEACVQRDIQALTLFAFSSENWRRPAEEVGLLMRLFVEALQREVETLHEQHVRVRFVGALDRLSESIQEQIRESEALTADNKGLTLVVAMAYGGRWDLAQAARRMAERTLTGELQLSDIDEQQMGRHLALAPLPDPDLFIRTGGERRVSNFLLWNMAYTEFYFSDLLWPEFDSAALDAALEDYAQRQRRFGKTGEQLHA